MGMWIAVLALLLFATGCGSDQAMKVEAQRVLGGWPQATRDFASSLELERHDGKEFVHGRLVNLTSRPITVNESLLPWNSPGQLNLEGITRRGARLPHYPLEIEPMSGDRFVAIAAGARMEGEFETRYLKLPLDRKQEVLLVWSYGVADRKGPAYLLKGTLYLPAADAP